MRSIVNLIANTITTIITNTILTIIITMRMVSGGLGGSSWAIHEQYPQGYYTPTPPPPQCVEPSLNTQLLPPSASSL